MATTTNLSNLVINYLTQAQYDAAAQAGTLDENQIYLTPATEIDLDSTYDANTYTVILTAGSLGDADSTEY